MSKRLTIKQTLLVFISKILYYLMRFCRLQASSKPGEFLYHFAPELLNILLQDKKLIVVSGTNGKTSTSSFIYHLLKKQKIKIGYNSTGANMRSGLLTSIVLNYKKVELFILEIDEAVLASEAKNLKIDLLVLTNLFRDQLDRYGELENLKKLMQQVLDESELKACLINADDPLLSSLKVKENCQKYFFGKDLSSYYEENDSPQNDDIIKPDKNNKFDIEEAYAMLDNSLCPLCHSKLFYYEKTIAHLGAYKCQNCLYQRPEVDYSFSLQNNYLRINKGKLTNILRNHAKYESYATKMPFRGLYNAYNFACAIVATDIYKDIYLRDKQLSLKDLTNEIGTLRPSFGRLERIKIPNTNKEICFLLAKNPAGYNQVLELLTEMDDIGGFILGLNSNPPDGRDVSWIWDISLEKYFATSLNNYKAAFVGDRAEDLALRYSYAWPKSQNFKINKDEVACTKELLEEIEENKTLYIILNYTCMLEMRKKLAKAYGFSALWQK